MKIVFLSFMFLFLITGCNHAQEQENGANDMDKSEVKNKDATFVHTVFFWMKEDLSEEEAKFFEEGMEKLGKTPSILSYKWGKPAGTPRNVVDNSYTYAWIVDFASTADQDAYQVDPIHLKFIEESKHLWTKVQVYDTILE